MSGEKWLTVRQFADAAGVTTEAVRQRLAKDLQSYVKMENGRRFIDSEALQFIGKARASQGLDKDLTRTCKELDKDLQSEIEAIKDECSRLRQDLHALEISAAVSAAERDAARQHEHEQAATITALTESLHMAQKQCAEEKEEHKSTKAELSAARAELSAALERAQSLHAGTIRGQLEASAGDPAGVIMPVSAPEKSSLFSRIFRKKK